MNTANERLRHAYLEHLRHAKGLSDKTIDAAMRHLTELEAFIHGRDFADLTKSQAKAFKQYLQQRPSKAGAASLSASSIVHTLADLKAFFDWLSATHGRKVDPEAIARLSPPRRSLISARTPLASPLPTSHQIRQMLAAIGDRTVLERRDRALVSFIFLTGMRVAAVISTQCRHVNLETRQVSQDARVVNTKFGKNMLTSWFPVGRDVEEIVVDWLKERVASGAQPEAPLFPAAPRHPLPSAPPSRAEKFWQTSQPVREIFRAACKSAGIDYINPHALRGVLMRLGLETCATWEELKAWSQNLGHEKLDTSLIHYGTLDTSRQNELMQGLVRTDVTVREEQELLIKFRAVTSKKRTAVLDLLAPS